MIEHNWIRTTKPNKLDKIPLSLFNFTLTEYQKLCNRAWYHYENVWIPSIWIVDNYLLKYIQFDIYGNEISRCNYCNDGYCSNINHNNHWKKYRLEQQLSYENQIQELQILNFQLYEEIDKLNYINMQQTEEIKKLRRETFEEIPNIISSVVDSVLEK